MRWTIRQASDGWYTAECLTDICGDAQAQTLREVLAIIGDWAAEFSPHHQSVLQAAR